MLEEPFVDRNEELKRLEELLRDVKSRKTRTVFLCGESGIGKRALADEFIGRHKDIPLLKHNCTSADKRTPFALLSGLLGQRSMKKVRKGMGETGKEKDEFYAEIATLFTDISKKKSSLVFIDNYQWADHSSVVLLSYLATKLKDARLMIVAAYSPELEGGDFISSTITTLTLEGCAHTLILARFNEDASKKLLEKILRTNVTADFSRRIFEEAQGHPLFTASLAKSLVEEGIVDPKDKDWMKKLEGLKLKFPKSVKELIARRIQLLDSRTKRVLRAASVLGTQFRADLLARVLKADEVYLHEKLSKLTESKLIYQDVEAKKETYNFDHANVRETVYKGMERGERKVLHRLAANAFEAMHKDKAEFAYPLAHHFSHSGQHDKAFKYAKLAGENALQQNAPEEAIRHLKDSLESLRKSRVRGKTKLKHSALIKLGEANFITGDWTEAHKYYKLALIISRGAKDKSLRSLSGRKFGELLRFKGEYSLARKHFEEALSTSEKIGDSRGVADSYKGLGYLYWRQGDYAKATEFYDRCVTTAKKLKDHALLGVAFLEKGNVCNTMGDLEKALGLYKRCLKHLERLNDLSQIARAYNNMGDVSLQRGDWTKAIKYFERSRKAAKKIGGRYMVAWSLFNEGEALARLNKTDEALKKCRESFEILSSLGDKMGLVAVHKNFGIVYGLKRNWKKAEENFRRSLALARDLKIPDVMAEIHLHRAKTLAAKGEKEKAKSNLLIALKIARGIKAKQWIARIEKAFKVLR